MRGSPFIDDGYIVYASKYELSVNYTHECKKYERDILTFCLNACIIYYRNDMSKKHESGRRTPTRISKNNRILSVSFQLPEKRNRAELRIHIQNERTDYVK